MEAHTISVTISPSGETFKVPAVAFQTRSGLLNATVKAQEITGWGVSSLLHWSSVRVDPSTTVVKLKEVTPDTWEHYQRYVLESQEYMPQPQEYIELTTDANLVDAIALLRLCIQLDDSTAFTATLSMLTILVDETGDELAPPAFAAILGSLMGTPWTGSEVQKYSTRLTAFMAEIAAGDYKSEVQARHSEMASRLANEEAARISAEGISSCIKIANSDLSKAVHAFYEGEAVYKRCTVVDGLLKQIEGQGSELAGLRSRIGQMNEDHASKIKKLCGAHAKQKLVWQHHIDSELKLIEEDDRRKVAVRATLQSQKNEIRHCLGDSSDEDFILAPDLELSVTDNGNTKASSEILKGGPKRSLKRTAEEAHLTPQSNASKRPMVASTARESTTIDPKLLDVRHEKDDEEVFTRFTNLSQYDEL